MATVGGRLLCTSELQQLLDSKYSVSEWSSLYIQEALKVVEKYATDKVDAYALWKKLFSVEQKQGESALKFFRRVERGFKV